MKRLLVIADKTGESQEAFDKALGLARKTGAAIRVVIFELLTPAARRAQVKRASRIHIFRYSIDFVFCEEVLS